MAEAFSRGFCRIVVNPFRAPKPFPMQIPSNCPPKWVSSCNCVNARTVDSGYDAPVTRCPALLLLLLLLQVFFTLNRYFPPIWPCNATQPVSVLMPPGEGETSPVDTNCKTDTHCKYERKRCTSLQIQQGDPARQRKPLYRRLFNFSEVQNVSHTIPSSLFPSTDKSRCKF